MSNTAGGAGGTAATGDIRINGGTGSDGQTGSSLLTGNGGASYFGGGGRAGSQAGIAGAAPGSGGGGAYDLGFTSTAYSGGDGADGILIWKNSRDGAWLGHGKSVNFAKYCKQRMLDAISSH